jgi:hypothetical protein
MIKRTLADAATYRRLVYLVSALGLGPVWFVALVTVWSLCLGRGSPARSRGRRHPPAPGLP